MKVSELRTKSASELNDTLLDLKKELLHLRFQHTVHQLENPLRLRAVKKDIARLKTLLREIEVGQDASPKA